jgi:hypothetical protein
MWRGRNTAAADAAPASAIVVMDRLQNEVHHSRRCGEEEHMVYGMRVHPSLHAPVEGETVADVFYRARPAT